MEYAKETVKIIGEQRRCDMSKFDYNNFYSDDCEWCVCNAKKYTKEQALEIAKIELSTVWDNEVDKNMLIIESAWVRYGFGIDLNEERQNGYWLEFEPIGNCTEVWAVSRKKV